MKQISIAVLMGGISSEREISLASGKQIINALRKQSKYRIFIYDIKNDLGKLFKDKDKIDVAIPALHGRFGEDGAIQGLLELLQIPYTHSNVSASALGMDKNLQKKLFKEAGIPIPDYRVLEKNESFKSEVSQLYSLIDKKKLVVKPNTEGSSMGVSICQSRKELDKGIKEAFKYDYTIIVEDYINGTELTVGVLGNKENSSVLPVVEIIPKTKFFDYEAKYDGSTQEIVPARIPDKLAKLAQRYAALAHKTLGCSGVTRVDMILDKNRIFILEINTIPGITKESLIPKAAKAIGINFGELIDRLIQIALEEHGAKKKS
ncbi:MAG: D-alanine--D-alanine ligase [Candidatus Berkelbacteria bacterium]|nr:D-alanine--D-alanine ligase [Candidatus Berkelbacteria bacterium]